MGVFGEKIGGQQKKRRTIHRRGGSRISAISDLLCDAPCGLHIEASDLSPSWRLAAGS